MNRTLEAALKNSDISLVLDNLLAFKTWNLNINYYTPIFKTTFDLLDEANTNEDFVEFDKKKSKKKYDLFQKFKREYADIPRDKLEALKTLQPQGSTAKQDESESDSDSDSDQPKKKPMFGKKKPETDSEDSDSDDEPNNKTKNQKNQPAQKFEFMKVEDSDSDSDSDDSDQQKAQQDQEEDSDWDPSTSSEDGGEVLEDYTNAISTREERRMRWLLTDEDRNQNQKTKLKQSDKKKRNQRERKVVELEEDNVYKTVDEVETRLMEIYAIKTKERMEQSQVKAELLLMEAFVDDLKDKFKVYYNVLKVENEYSLFKGQDRITDGYCIPLQVYDSLLKHIKEIVSLILNTKDFKRLVESDIQEVVLQEQKHEAYGTLVVSNSIAYWVEVLNDQQYRALRVLSTMGKQYRKWFSYEQKLQDLLIDTQKMYDRFSQKNSESSKITAQDNMSRVVFLRLQHYYGRSDKDLETLRLKLNPNFELSKYKENLDISTLIYDHKLFCMFTASESRLLIKTLTSLILKYNQEKSYQAMFYYIYWLSDNDFTQQAKDLLTMMNLGDKLDGLPRETKMFYNRVIAALAMSLFRRGEFGECYRMLNPMMSLLKEGQLMFTDLIGQSNSDPLIQKMTPTERRKTILPYHEHLDADLLKYVFLLSSVFHEYKVLNRNRRHYDYHFNQINSNSFVQIYNEFFTYGSVQACAETVDENLMQTFDSILDADWQSALACLKKLGFSDYVYNRYCAIVEYEVKKICTFCYLRNYAAYLDNISAEDLSEFMGIEVKEMEGLLASLLVEKEIVNQDDKSVSVRRAEEYDQFYQLTSKIKTSIALFNNILEFAIYMDKYINDLNDNKYSDTLVELKDSQKKGYTHYNSVKDNSVNVLKHFVQRDVASAELRQEKENHEYALKYLNNFWRDKEKLFQKV